MKKLLSKVLFLSISATLMFTACEDDDKGVNNGPIVGEWGLESIDLLYERVVSVPAGEDQNQRYVNYLDWDANGDAATEAFFEAIGGKSSAAYLGATVSPIDLGDGDLVPGFPRAVVLNSPAALAGFGVALELVIEDAPKRGEPGTYSVTGTYPTIRQANCQSNITIASITDQGVYISDFDMAGNEKLGNFMIEPDPVLGGAVLPPFNSGSYTVVEGMSGAADQLKIDYVDLDGHDTRYTEVMDSWSEADDRVIQGYNLQFNDAEGYLASADPNPAVLNPAYEGGFLRREALPAAYSNTMTFFFYNASVSASAQAQDAKNPLTDLDGDGTVGIGDMVVFMHYDNLAGGGGKTPMGVPYVNMVDSSDPTAPKIVDDSGTVFSGANPNAGGRLYYKVREGLCVPTDEVITVKSVWERHDDDHNHD